MRISMSCTAILAYVVIGHPPPAVAQVDQQRAQQYFKEAQTLCERDGGRLWGVSLCGPMVIADAATGTIATSQPAPAGDRPRAIGFVNAPVQWGGITWSAYNWQMIPKDDQGERGRLFMHELFHCIQPRLGLTTAEAPALAKTAISIRWRAATGCASSGGPWRGRLAPLARRARPPLRMRWRFARRATSAFPGAAAAEHAVDINEGIATYTQYVTGSESAQDAIRNAMAALAAAETGTSFVRTFAYASGAGYGLLLDALSPGWHRKITAASDFGQLLSAAAGVTAAPDAAAAAARYDGASAAGCRRAARSRAAGDHRRAAPPLRRWAGAHRAESRERQQSTTWGPRSFPARARSSGQWRTKAHGDFSMRRAARWSRPMERRYRCRRRSSSMRRR